jgi:hypothetical protein
VTPRVLLVGGFLTLPLNYWPLRRRLLARGAAGVDIAPIWPLDWALATVLGMAPVVRRTRLAIMRAYQAADREPIIVIGHSGGGIAARLAMSSVPFYGQRGGVAEAVGCLVTLGSPHGLARLPNRYHHAGHEAVEFLDRESPGSFFAPRTAYLSVGSSYEQAAFGGVVGRLAEEIFSVIVGNDAVRAGDGIVPFSAVHLEGATQLSFSDARHGHIGANWYGADGVVDRWWPQAEKLWQGALEARLADAAPAGRQSTREPLTPLVGAP